MNIHISIAPIARIVGAFALLAAGAAAQRAGIHDLGTLGGDYAKAQDMNGRGHVVGESATVGQRTHAFLWQSQEKYGLWREPWSATPYGTMTDLGVLPGYTGSTAAALNNHDQVVGISFDVVFDPTPRILQRAFLWEKGLMQDLGALPGDSYSIAYDINDGGQIVGSSISASSVLRAVVWRNGRITELPKPPGSTFALAMAINGAGEIVGGMDGRAIMWRSGVPIVLDLPSGMDWASAVDINNRGQVLGVVGRQTPWIQRCVIWQDGVMKDLGFLPDCDTCFARSINDRGEVVGRVGSILPHQGTPFIWIDGVMTGLNTFIPSGSGWTVDEAAGISDAREVIGRGSNGNGPNRAFMLSLPVIR